MKIVVYFPLFGGRYKKHLTQREDVAQFVQNNTAHVNAEFEETKPGLAELRNAIAKAKKSGATIIFSRLGYLTKNLKFLRALADCGVMFHALDDDRFNPNTFQVYLKLAKEEWHVRRTRIKDGMAKAKAEGAVFASAQPGHWNRKNKHLRGWKQATEASAKKRQQRANDAYAPILPMMLQMREKGESYDAIAQALNDAGHLTSAGTQFTVPTVFKIIKRHGGLNDRTRRKGMGRPAGSATAKR